MVNDASTLVNNIIVEFIKFCIPRKTILVCEDDKPWYDSEIRRNSRKRDRLKKKAITIGNVIVWAKFKGLRNKVNKKNMLRKVRKRAKIRNRYNQTPHLTQDTNG